MFGFFQGNKTKLQQKREANPDINTKSNRQIENDTAKSLDFDTCIYKAKAAVIQCKYLTKSEKNQILSSNMTPEQMKAAVKKAKEDKGK